MYEKILNRLRATMELQRLRINVAVNAPWAPHPTAPPVPKPPPPAPPVVMHRPAAADAAADAGG